MPPPAVWRRSRRSRSSNSMLVRSARHCRRAFSAAAQQRPAELRSTSAAQLAARLRLRPQVTRLGATPAQLVEVVEHLAVVVRRGPSCTPAPCLACAAKLQLQPQLLSCAGRHTRPAPPMPPAPQAPTLRALWEQLIEQSDKAQAALEQISDSQAVRPPARPPVRAWALCSCAGCVVAMPARRPRRRRGRQASSPLRLLAGRCLHVGCNGVCAAGRGR